MLQCLGRCAALLRIETQAPVQEINKQRQVLDLRIRHASSPLAHKPGLQVARGLLEVNNASNRPTGDLVFLRAVEVEHVVEMEMG